MKPFLYLFIIVIFSNFIFVGCSMTEQQEFKSILLNELQSEEVSEIKNIIIDDTYPLGELIDNSLQSPTYELYNPAEDGNTYVTIKGNISYAEQDVVATLQYKDIGEGRYEFSTLALNDIPQNGIFIAQFFDFLISNYNNLSKYENTEVENDMDVEKLISNAMMEYYGYETGYIQIAETYESVNTDYLPPGTFICAYEIDSENFWYVNTITGEVYHEIDSEGNVINLSE